MTDMVDVPAGFGYYRPAEGWVRVETVPEDPAHLLAQLRAVSGSDVDGAMETRNRLVRYLRARYRTPFVELVEATGLTRQRLGQIMVEV